MALHHCKTRRHVIKMGITFWTLNNVKQLLDILGFSYLWDCENITQLQVIQIIERLYDNFCKDMFGELNSMTKLSTYK